MATESRLVKLLIEKLAQKSGQPMDMAGYERMSDYIEDKLGEREKVSKKYLYETYTRVSSPLRLNNKKDKSQVLFLDRIAKAIGYDNYLKFTLHIDKPVDAEVQSLLGNWWSIVRANKGAYLLKAPVQIFLSEHHEPVVRLRGEHHLFEGAIHYRSGNIFCELDSGKDKKLYIILKVGLSAAPKLLQGVFTGVSTAGDPIAGRELLLREEQLDFTEMKWERLSLRNSTLENAINNYFKSYEGNCIKVNEVSSFNLTDLE